MKSGDLQRAFGVGATTIKNWVDTFEDFLSDGAKAMESRQRIFTGDDYLVMATIAQLSLKEKLPYAHVRERLAAGYRVESPTSATVGYEDGRMVPAAAVEQIVDGANLRIELETIRNERDRLLNVTENQAQKIDLLQDRIKELERQLGKAEGRLEEIERQRNKRK